MVDNTGINKIAVSNIDSFGKKGLNILLAIKMLIRPLCIFLPKNKCI